MKAHSTRKRKLIAALITAGLLTCISVSQAGVVTPDLEAELQGRAPHEEVSVIITLRDRVDPRSFKKRDKHARRADMARALKDKAERSQRPLKTLLEGRGARRMKQLWLINGMAVKVRADVARALANLPEVESIRPDYVLQAPAVTLAAGAPLEWNLSAIGVQDVWSLGYSGAGVVVASMDTGVDPDHPDLSGKWRGGANSWFDPHGEHATPYDALGHGTQTMGILVGGDVSGAAIGVAPDAQWIAVKIFNDAGLAEMSDIHQGFQWLLDPDGDPATPDAPDVVNASWGLPGTAGQCLPEFDADIQALKAAGIGVAFAAGNDGPAPLTGVSPANGPGVPSTGAVDSALVLASFSSRGPSPCDGDIFPKLSAPGVGINTADLSFGGLPLYATVSGTSYATPHAAGAMALLLNAFPTTDVATLEAALTQSAQDLGVAGADNGYGYGLVDVLAAYNALNGGGGGNAPSITSAPVTTAIEGQAYAYPVSATDPDGDVLTFALDVAPAGMAIDPANGLITWTPDAAQVGVHPVTVRVTDDGGLSATQDYNVTVASANDAPVATNNSYSVNAGSTLTVNAPGVLANDSDPDGDALTAVLVGAPSGGSLTLNADGSFQYVPSAGTTADSFSYRASDGALTSNVATVSITVVPLNAAPVAANNSYSVNAGSTLAVNAPGVLANDSDPDGDALTAVLAAAPSGGSLTLNADGSFQYTPSAGTTADTFSYRASDGALPSNVATVSITVVSSNTAPVAANDSASTARNRAVTINVIANDGDSDGSINPATVKIVTAPNRGGRAVPKADGSVRYTPRRNFRGTEVFYYTVKDNQGLVSNAASVTVYVGVSASSSGRTPSGRTLGSDTEEEHEEKAEKKEKEEKHNGEAGRNEREDRGKAEARRRNAEDD